MMILPCLFALATPAPEVGFYIGTYTSDKGSKGIYYSSLNRATGALSEPRLAVESLAPSYVALHPNGRFLYAVHEFTNGDVSAYEIQPDKSLKKINTRTWKGSGPCHLSVDPSGRNVLAAAYTGGSFACFPVGADGALAEASWTFKNEGKAGQKPRGHMIQSDARSGMVYACDLGTDELLIFGFDASRGKLVQRPSAWLPAGAGPRHFSFARDGKSLYVNNEFGMSVTPFAVNGNAAEAMKTVSTLPAKYEAKGLSTAEIVTHPSGKWVYVSNRGHDSIAVLSVGTGGALTQVQVVGAGVETPRGFDIDPSGRWLVVAGQKSDDLTSLSIDQKTGKLKGSGSKVKVGTPVCVLFTK